MSKPRWTEQQQAVINSRKGNLLVAAAAGSGKTAVLVERIIQMITDPNNPIDVDSLLIVTFTNAAALEMKERIYSAIEKILQNTTEKNTHLEKQLVLLENSYITTIHSFCLDVIENFFYKVSLSPEFKIGSEEQFFILRKTALDNTFEHFYNLDDPEFLKLIQTYSNNKGDFPVREIIERLHSFVLSSPEPKQWLYESAEIYNISNDFDFLNTTLGQYFIEKLTMELKGIHSTLNSLVDQTEGIADLHSYHQRYTNEFYKVEGLINSLGGTWDDIRTNFQTFEFEDFRKGVKKVPKTADESIKNLQKSSKDIRDECKKKISTLRDNIFYKTSSDIVVEYNELYPLMNKISEVTSFLMDEYQRLKKEKNLIDFNDIEHLALQILTTKDDNGNFIPSDIAKIYSNKFEEIFIDEYQDSSLSQEVLLTAISKNDTNRFMVGDVKQSIYKFRQARPDIFIDKYNSYSLDTSTTKKKILLDKNFRSRWEILEATNYIFEHIMSDNAGGLEYGESEKLNLGGNFKPPLDSSVEFGGATDVYLVDNANPTKTKDNDDYSAEEEMIEELDKIQIEARVIAKAILDLMDPSKNFQVIDKKTNDYRPVNYGDIVILLRSTSLWSEIIEKELRNYNIPVSIETSSGYLKSFEIECIMNILKTINNPYDNIALIGMLRNPLFNISIDDLIEIKDYNIHDSIIHNLKALSIGDSKESPLKERATLILDKIEKYSNKNKESSLRETIKYIYTDSGLYLFVRSLKNGDVRCKNLDILLDKATEFESDGVTLHSFIQLIENLKDAGLDFNSAKPEKEEINSVRVMTIHRSKGLEFPVVICAGLGKKFNTSDSNSLILFHPDYGYGPQIIDKERNITYTSIAKETIKSRIINETLSEEIRILYVALTRPKEKLIMIGSVDDAKKRIEGWSQYLGEMNKIPEYAVLDANCYLDWIIPSILKHPNIKDLAKEFNIDNIMPSNHISKWTCSVINADEVKGDVGAIQSQKDNSKKDSVFVNSINSGKVSIFNPIEYVDSIYQTISVTDIVHGKKDVEVLAFEITDINKCSKPITGLERGSIIHDFMYKLNFNNISSKEDIENELKMNVKNGVFTKEEANVIPIDNIYKILTSDIGIRLKNAQNIRKEQPISAILSTEDLNVSYTNKADILVKGIIDIYFEENNEIVLIDYKSDIFEKEVQSETVALYKHQLELYKRALEKNTGKNVKEVYLSLLSKGISIKI